MRVVLQRVSRASVTVAGQVVGEIGRGWLALLAVAPGDGEQEASWLAEKVANMRAFPDADGKLNLGVLDVGGKVLIVSNFTLYGDCQKGRRPSFIGAARPEMAEPLCEAFVQNLKALGIPTAQGRFGADMQVELVNDGPVTLIVDTTEAPA